MVIGGRRRLNSYHMKTIFFIILFAMISPVVSLFGIPPNLIYVYKYGSPTIVAGDFERSPWGLTWAVNNFTRKERNGRLDRVSVFLYAQFDESARFALNRYATAEAQLDLNSDTALKELKTIANDTSVEAILVTNLNRIIRGPCIYDQERFRDVELSPQTKMLLKQNSKGEDLVRLNWLLLGDAYSTPSRDAIEAQGGISGIFKRKEKISIIDMFPRKLQEADLHDIWVELSPTNRIMLADITEESIRPDPSGLYYSYRFEDHKLVGFKIAAYDHGYPHYDENKTIRIGSLKNKSSLKLPCSLKDFEKVFGRADEVDRKFMW